MVSCCLIAKALLERSKLHLVLGLARKWSICGRGSPIKEHRRHANDGGDGIGLKVLLDLQT